MKKIVIAMDNFEVINYVKDINKYIVHNMDISYKEGLVEYLSKNKVQYIITRDTLEGDMTREIYIKQIRMVAPESKIILFVDYLDVAYKSFLFANEVFNIIEQKHITKDLLKDIIIEADNKIVYKNISSNNIDKHIANESSFANKYEFENPKMQVIPKKILAVFGTSGSGKSYIANILSNIISTNLGLNTLLIDFDVQNGSADIYGNINGENNSLSKIINEIDNNNLTSKTFEKYISKTNRNKASYITNNSSLFECQNKLTIKYYNEILSKAKEIYDSVILDTPNSIFLDTTYFNVINADNIVFVINPNYISIRQASKYLDLLINVWNVPKQKIFLIVNRVKKGSLSRSQIESLIGDLKIKLELKENPNIENILNGLSKLSIDNIDNLEEFYNIFGCNITSEIKNKKNEFGAFSKIFEGLVLK